MKLAELTLDQLRQLAPLVPTEVDYLRHLAAGRRQASAEMAGRIEAAALKMKLVIGRETLNDACRKCKYRKACTARSTTLAKG